MSDAMTETQTLLAALRPIRAPADDGALALVAMALLGAALGLAAAAVAARRRRRRGALRREASALLEGARGLAPQARLAAQARLARRLARAQGLFAPRLSGEAWLARLDALFRGSFFTQGEGRALGDALYRPEPASAETLAAIDRELLRLAARPPARAPS